MHFLCISFERRPYNTSIFLHYWFIPNSHDTLLRVFPVIALFWCILFSEHSLIDVPMAIHTRQRLSGVGSIVSCKFVYFSEELIENFKVSVIIDSVAYVTRHGEICS